MATDNATPQPEDELQRLRDENARLKALLIHHGIAWEARQLGAALISHTCERTRQLSLTNTDLTDAILRASGGRHPLDVCFSADEESKPWQRSTPIQNLLPDPLPESLNLVLANQIFIAKKELTNRLIRLAAFANPEFYKAQAMRLPVWNKPRIIGCAENHPQHIALPRGCLDEVTALLSENGIRHELRDECLSGRKVAVKFTGKLRKEQKAAVKEMLKQEIGVLSAPTAFGKTVTAAAIIARRKVSTLILVHRTELPRQWQERLTSD